jgi:hypothetical protein
MPITSLLCPAIAILAASTLPATQGTFGELPPAAGSQLEVVRSCAYHLLNMINMTRDMLRSLHNGDLELSLGRVQVVNSIEEVSLLGRAGYLEGRLRSVAPLRESCAHNPARG